MEESERRDRLHELDGILDALERLNLQDANQLPAALRDSLRGVGLDAGPQANVTELIEHSRASVADSERGIATLSGEALLDFIQADIQELQEQFLSSGAPAEAGGPRHSSRSLTD
jgi:hypothetical protein